MRVLITGGTGFLGSFIAKRRLACGDMVWATWLPGSPNNLKSAEGLCVVPCDVTASDDLEKVVRESQPDVIFHFAAQTFIGESWADPLTTLATNTLGTINLLELLRISKCDATVVVACSSAEYGEIAGRGSPVTESDQLIPVSPYGLSKLDQDMLGYLYFRTHRIRTIRARIFNTIGPGKLGDFLADFCQQIVAIEAGEVEPVLRTGELSSRRDLSDVRDTVAALDLLSIRGIPGEAYNVCSGKTVRIGDMVQILLAASTKKIRLQVESTRLRPFEESIIWGDNRKLVECTEWSPLIEVKQTVQDTLQYWRQKRASDASSRTQVDAMRVPPANIRP